MFTDEEMEDILTPEIEARFNSLSEENQQEVIGDFTGLINKTVGEWTLGDAPTKSWKEYVDFFRQKLVDKMDEIEGKRRELWLL